MSKDIMGRSVGVSDHVLLKFTVISQSKYLIFFNYPLTVVIGSLSLIPNHLRRKEKVSWQYRFSIQTLENQVLKK